MRGRVAARPLSEIAAAAGVVFTAKGYRDGGISDVANALGLSHGALYTYVRSKEALLYVALMYGIDAELLAEQSLPVATPTKERFAELLERKFTPRPTATADERYARPVADDLGELIDELYGFVEGNRDTLALIERTARDFPQLAEVFFLRRRATIGQIGTYLRHRIDAGELRPVPDVPTAARFIVETIAWFAWHRIGDPDSAMLDDDTCRSTVRHLLLAAFLPIPVS